QNADRERSRRSDSPLELPRNHRCRMCIRVCTMSYGDGCRGPDSMGASIALSLAMSAIRLTGWAADELMFAWPATTAIDIAGLPVVTGFLYSFFVTTPEGAAGGAGPTAAPLVLVSELMRPVLSLAVKQS